MAVELTKDDVREIFREEITLQRERRLEEAAKRAEAKEKEGEATSLMLVTVPRGALALPDEKGRAVFVDAFYARVPIGDGGRPNSYGSHMTVVAWGDGRALEHPLRIYIGSFAACEVPDGMLIFEESSR